MNVLFVIPLSLSYGAIFASNQNVSLASKIKVVYDRDYFKRRLKPMYPMGALSIASYIKNHEPNINIKMLDLNSVMLQKDLSNIKNKNEYKLENLFMDSFARVENFKPDIIAISALWTTFYSDLNPLVLFLRNYYNKSLIVCGGHLASTLYKNLYEDNIDIDALCFGEGEIPFLELLINMKRGGNYKDYLFYSDQWITKEKLKDNGFVPNVRLINNLDEIPILDLSVAIDKEEYFNPHHSFFEIVYEKPRQMFLFTTRGCPYQCVFCASHVVHGRKVRYHSLERVKRDIIEYNRLYGTTKFVVFDDHFLVDKKRGIEILNFITDCGFTAEITTPAFFSIDAEVAKAMRRAGILTTCITIESGNEDTLKNIIHKPSNLEQAEKAIEYLHNEGISVITNILVGFPGETKESIDKGLEYLLTTNYNWFQIYTVSPLPGSDLYKTCIEGDFLSIGKEYSLLTFFSSCVKTPEFTPEYINLKVYEMNLLLNFVNNYDMRSGNYAMALYLFEKLINTINPNHAFACFYASRCCEKLGLLTKSEMYMSRYDKIISQDQFWKGWSEKLIIK